MSTRDRRARATGKASTPVLRHVRLHHYLLRTHAWRSLDCYSRAALVELYAIYNGENNGEVGMSERRLAQLLNCSAPTARKALRQLLGRGFVRVGERGSFHRKVPHATKWILTEFPKGNALPTKDFVRWVPKSDGADKLLRRNVVTSPAKRGCAANNDMEAENAITG